MQIIDLRTERQCTPIQIDSAHPRFSWRVDTKEQNWYQESYRIQVWKTCLGKKQCKVWDSGTVLSRAMSQIPYEGEPLKSDSCYSWTVEVLRPHSIQIANGMQSGSQSHRIPIICIELNLKQMRKLQRRNYIFADWAMKSV